MGVALIRWASVRRLDGWGLRGGSLVPRGAGSRLLQRGEWSVGRDFSWATRFPSSLVRARPGDWSVSHPEHARTRSRVRIHYVGRWPFRTVVGDRVRGRQRLCPTILFLGLWVDWRAEKGPIEVTEIRHRSTPARWIELQQKTGTSRLIILASCEPRQGLVERCDDRARS